jgi:beta-glucoside operon transcriptional antiterminator
MPPLKIYKPINNNIVSAFDDDGAEIIVIGRGLGYKAAEGAEISADIVQKVFRMSSQHETDRLKALFASIPDTHLELTDKIFTYAREKLNKRLNERAFISLADHLNFAVQRHNQGMDFQNVLLTEVRHFYPEEYAIGKHALELIREELGISFPDDEAASIALHIFNAEYDVSISSAFHVTKLIDSIIAIAASEFGGMVKDGDYFSERFLLHTKLLALRVINKESPAKHDEKFSGFMELTSARYPQELACAQKIAAYISSEHGYELSQEEIFNLTMHMKRIRV